MAKLIITSEEMKGRAFELTGEKVSIGRSSDNQISIEHNAVSSHHAELIQKGNDYIVRDLNSTNGTRVNGQRIVETRLYHGDTIVFGYVQLQYISTATAAPKPLPAPLKRTIDLSNIKPENAPRTTTFGSSSPFATRKQNSRSTLILLITFILGITAVTLLVFVISKIFFAGG